MLYSEVIEERSPIFGPQHIDLKSLTMDELEELKRVNEKLTELDDYVFQEARKLHQQLENTLDHLGDKYSDQEFEIEIEFYFKEGLGFDESAMENPAVVMRCSSLVENMNVDVDHNDLNDLNDALSRKLGKHCALFHALYDHTELGWRQILMLGRCWVDFKLICQKHLPL